MECDYCKYIDYSTIALHIPRADTLPKLKHHDFAGGRNPRVKWCARDGPIGLNSTCEQISMYDSSASRSTARVPFVVQRKTKLPYTALWFSRCKQLSSTIPTVPWFWLPTNRYRRFGYRIHRVSIFTMMIGYRTKGTQTKKRYREEPLQFLAREQKNKCYFLGPLCTPNYTLRLCIYCYPTSYRGCSETYRTPAAVPPCAASFYQHIRHFTFTHVCSNCVARFFHVAFHRGSCIFSSDREKWISKRAVFSCVRSTDVLQHKAQAVSCSERLFSFYFVALL